MIIESEKTKIKVSDRLLKLIEVKSIVTLVLVFAATYGFLTGLIEKEIFSGWVGMILVYFFTKDKKGE